MRFPVSEPKFICSSLRARANHATDNLPQRRNPGTAHRAFSTRPAIRNALKAVRTALNRGDCKAAVGTLADAGFYAGRMAAHSSSRSLIIKNRRPRGKGSVGGAGVSALRQVEI